MKNKQYNLKSILSESAYQDMAYFLLPTFLDGSENKFFGVDAMSMVGLDGMDAVALTKVVQMFQSLADPKFVNLREDWGTSFAGANEVLETLPTYAGEKFNSFALKNMGGNLSYVEFPLFQSHMGAGSAFQSNAFSWETLKQNFEKALGITILEVANLENALSKKIQNSTSQVALDGKLKKDGILKRSARKILSPVIFVKNKITGQEKNSLDQKSLRIDKAFSKCLISNEINGHKLSEVEKALALTDALSHESTKRFALNDKTTKAILSSFEEADKRKLLYASQLTADMFAAFAQDMGAENHRQIENALKLQIANVLASMKDKSYRATKAYGLISERLTFALLKQLNLSNENIVVARHNMGVDYVDQFPVLEDGQKVYNLHQVMFGRIQNNALSIKNGTIFYDGESPAFEKLQPFALDAEVKPIAPFERNPEVPENLPPQSITPIVEAQPTQKPTRIPRIITIDDIFDAFGEEAEEKQEATPTPAQAPVIENKPVKNVTLRELVARERAKINETMHAKGDESMPEVQGELKSPIITPQEDKPLSNKPMFAIHLPKPFRKAINENNFKSPQAQEFLSCMQSAIEKGKVVVEPRKYAQDALDAGIKLEQEHLFVYMATSQSALYEVRRNLEAICQKYGRVSAHKSEKNVKPINPVKAKEKKPTAKKQKKEETLVVKVPKRVRDAINEQNLDTPEMQEYLSYIYNAMQKGEIKVAQKEVKKEITMQGIRPANADMVYYVAKDGKTLYKINADLGEIRKKYEKVENSSETKLEDVYPKPVFSEVQSQPTSKPEEVKVPVTAPEPKSKLEIRPIQQKQPIVMFDETHSESKFPRENYLESTEYMNKILAGTRKYLAYKKAAFIEKGEEKQYIEKFLGGLDSEIKAEYYAKELAEFLGVEQKEIVLEKRNHSQFVKQCKNFDIRPQNYVKNSYCVEDDKNIYYKLVLDMPKQILQDVAKEEYRIESFLINAKPVPRTGYRDEFYPYIKYVRDSRVWEEAEEKVDASDFEPAKPDAKLEEDKKQVEEKANEEKTEKVIKTSNTKYKTLACKKCRKKQNETVCMGKDGTIYFPFN